MARHPLDFSGGGGRRNRRPSRQERESAEIMAELREEEARESASSTGAIAGAIVAGAMAFGQSVVTPEQASTETLNNYGESSQQEAITNRDRTLRGATRYKGYQSGGSSQSS